MNSCPEKVELRDYSPGDEKRIVQILGACGLQRLQDEKRWRWTHLSRPGFIRQDVVTAYMNGEMVGCFHGAVLPLRIEAGLDVLMSFDGDFAVLPDYRGKGIPDAAHDLADRRLLERGVVLRGGFTSPGLNEHFYKKRFGYVFVQPVTTRFRKIFGLGPVREKVRGLGEKLLTRPVLRRVLERQPLTVNFLIKDLPPCHLELTAQSFHLCHGINQEAQLRVRAPIGVLAVLDQGIGPFVMSCVVNLVRGRLRVHGLFRKGPSLLKLLWATLVSR